MFKRLAVTIIALPTANVGWADVIVNHPPPPSPGYGSGADTSFEDPFGNAVWQISANDFILSAQAGIRRVAWWGVYGDPTFEQGGPNPPSGEETMRVRFYAARPSDGLPDDTNILHEESFLNVPRTWTGRWSGLRREWFFEADLSTPLTLSAGTAYWFEVAQVGILSSLFVWEWSVAEQNGIAVMSTNVPTWHHAANGSDLAFQLSNVPEPATATLLSLGSMLIIGRGRGGRC